jgi:hypothetical protein
MPKKIEFEPLPNSVPEGTQVGGEFDLVTTYRLEESGRVCIVQMGEVKSDYDEKGEKSMIRPGMDDEIQAMQSSMSQGDMSQAG